MRVLALDPGTRRVGVAVSDDTETLALPLEFIEAEPFDAFLERLKAIIDSRRVERLVVGLPRNMDGSYGPSAQKTREWVARLQPLVSVEIKTWDERLTSVQAHRMLRETGMRSKERRTKVDQSAAAILLQSYLDSLQLRKQFEENSP
jgi:putative Holliday junction resolvase